MERRIQPGLSGPSRGRGHRFARLRLGVRCGLIPTWRSQHGHPAPDSRPPETTQEATHRGQARLPSRAQDRPPLPEPPAEATESAIRIFPPELAALIERLPADVELPPEILAAMVLPRVPLANAALTAWSYLLRPEFLDDLFARDRGRSYEDILDFPTFVALIRDALVLHRGSGLASFERAEEQGELPTCQEAVYAKLRRVPPGLSMAFLEEITERLRALLPRGHRLRSCRHRWMASRS
jgi:hypothetical protein